VSIETCRCGHSFEGHLGDPSLRQDPCAGGTPGFCGCSGYRPAGLPEPPAEAQPDLMRRWFSAYEYDFNNTHGEVTVSRQVYEEDVLTPGTQIILVTIDGDDGSTVPLSYSGFGTVVTITGVKDAHSPDHVRILTDLNRKETPGA
jgi:hypothetical protein